MCEYFGYRVEKLVRTRIMNIELGDLPVGTYRDVTPEEYRKLKTLIRDSSNETVIPVKNRTGRELTGEKDRESRYRKPEKNKQKRMERE